MPAWQKTMAICRSSSGKVLSWCAASVLLGALVSCSEGESANSPNAAPADWLEVAQASLRFPRQASFVIASGRGGEKVGKLNFQDQTHFRVESALTVGTTTPSGEATTAQLEIVSAADGETLRIQLPAVFGAPASVAVFPVQRFADLEAVGPSSPLHRYRLESLSPVHMARALLAACSEIEAEHDNKNAGSGEAKPTGTRSFSASIHASSLIELGILDASEQEKSFVLQLDLDQASGKFAGLQVVGVKGGIGRFSMLIHDFTAPVAFADKGFTLPIPDGQVVVDLALQLPR